MSEKIYNDPEIGEVILKKSIRSRRLTVRVGLTGGVSVTMPYFVPYAEGVRLVISRREWILKVQEKLRLKSADCVRLAPEDVERLRAEAKQYLPGRLAMLASEYGFRYSRVAVKNNRSNWGSCSSRGNINLNLRLMLVPEHLRDYVMLHELSHLEHPDHGPDFHLLLEKLCRDHFSKENALSGMQGQVSRSKYPVSHALEKELRKYRLY